MSVMKFTLTILAIAGCWRPFSWTSLIKHALYNAYTLLIISFLYSFTFTQFMDLILNVDNPDDFTSTLFTMLTMCVSCYKIFSMWMNHENIATLIQALTMGLFKPVVPVEIEIQRKFDKMIQTYAMCYTIMIIISCAGNILISLLTNFKERKLTFREWVPYDYSSYVIFCLTYTHQYLGIIASCFVNISCDSLIIGLLLHLCCQLTILKYRLKNITNDQSILRECVRHHHHIIEYAHATNARFSKIIAFQFLVSTFVVCSSLYQITKMVLSAYQISLITYVLCILAQIFIYCWFGNKLKLTSIQLVNSIFEIEWITLDNKIKKSLLIIMNRAIIPIEFISAYLLNVNLDSFVGLLKTSYSAYNLLIQIQE
ncbi:odorant receptor Or1-like [Camponotus floridanus]|nr:odorant receptor Or1-like [Camponotus floridanus]